MKMHIKSAAYRTAVANAAGITGASFYPNGLPVNAAAATALYWAALAPFGLAQDGSGRGQCGHFYSWGENGEEICFPLPPSRSDYGHGGLFRAEGQGASYCNAPFAARLHSTGAAKMFRKWAACLCEGRKHARYQIADLRVRKNETRARPDPLEAGGFMQRCRKLSLTPKVFRYDRAIGVEFEAFGAVREDALAASLPVWAQRKHDGSISPARSGQWGHEVVALLVRREMEPRLFRLCAKMQSAGLAVNASCGFHVHLDQRGECAAGVKKRAAIIDKWLSALRELVPVSRRDNSYAKFGISSTDRYRAVNITSFSKHQTLEIRLHGGTTDYTKALAWIRLVEMLAALHKGPRAASGCIATLEQLPLAAHDLAYWRARHAQLNPHLYGSANGGSNAEQE